MGREIKKIGIIGHFGENKHFTDGQTVKTVNLYTELKKATNWEIKIVDTYLKTKNPFLLLLKTLKLLITTKDIIVLLSGNGMKFYFPLLYYSSKFMGNRIYHDVIGGNLNTYVQKFPKYKTYLNSFCVNYVETDMLKKELIQCGVLNVSILPNFRCVQTVSAEELQSDYSEPYKFCTFSRVIKEKGIEDAILAIEKINKKAQRKMCCLDIYGPVDSEYKQSFKRIMRNSTKAIQYKGEIPSTKAIETLKTYYGVLFPTYWDGESNAGTVTESFFAGVPVIATDWRCNGEMIINGYNGLIYPSELAQNLEDGIYWLIEQKDRILKIKKNCIQSANVYKPDRNIKKIINFIESR